MARADCEKKGWCGVTGQLFFRNAFSDNNVAAGKGRKLMMVVGIIAVPNDTSLKPEHRYTVMDAKDGSQLTIVLSSAEDLTKIARGYPLGGLLTRPIWRV